MKKSIFNVSVLNTEEGRSSVMQHLKENKVAIFTLNEGDEVGIAITLIGCDKCIEPCQYERHCVEIIHKMDEAGFFKIPLPYELKSMAKIKLPKN